MLGSVLQYYQHAELLLQPPLLNAVLKVEFRGMQKIFPIWHQKPQSVPAPLLIGIELNPGPPNLTEKQRWRIVFLSEDCHKTPTHIARKVGCTRQTVYDVLERERSTGGEKSTKKWSKTEINEQGREGNREENKEMRGDSNCARILSSTSERN